MICFVVVDGFVDVVVIFVVVGVIVVFFVALVVVGVVVVFLVNFVIVDGVVGFVVIFVFFICVYCLVAILVIVCFAVNFMVISVAIGFAVTFIVLVNIVVTLLEIKPLSEVESCLLVLVEKLSVIFKLVGVVDVSVCAVGLKVYSGKSVIVLTVIGRTALVVVYTKISHNVYDIKAYNAKIYFIYNEFEYFRFLTYIMLFMHS